MSGWSEVYSGDMTIKRRSTSNTLEIITLVDDLDGTKMKNVMYLEDQELKDIAKCIDNIKELDPDYLK